MVCGKRVYNLEGNVTGVRNSCNRVNIGKYPYKPINITGLQVIVWQVSPRAPSSPWGGRTTERPGSASFFSSFFRTQGIASGNFQAGFPLKLRKQKEIASKIHRLNKIIHI